VYFLCEKTDSRWFRIIEKYFARMLRRLQFIFRERVIFISCVDQKLSTLQAIHLFLQQNVFLLKKRVSNLCSTSFAENLPTRWQHGVYVFVIHNFSLIPPIFITSSLPSRVPCLTRAEPIGLDTQISISRQSIY